MMMSEKTYGEYPHHLEGAWTSIINRNYPFDINVRFTFKERIKVWIGLHNNFKFQCWAINRMGIGYLVNVDLRDNKAHFLGKKRNFGGFR
ncbi:hypothetical protein LCGC14_0737750 [marine sediment metagenome]|uniref:Uncharacterized protein n=1 Tax=marine sediment metagenome TaxID=412755 RepID=A0A0F9QBS9_9ZZZZ